MALAELNHFAIAAGLGATIGPRVKVRHGQIGSPELADALSRLLRLRGRCIDDPVAHEDVTRKCEKAVTNAFLNVRNGFSADRVLADPDLNAKFLRMCRNAGSDDTDFHLNLALIGLRKHNKLKAKSKRSAVPDQWRYAVASEIAARVMYYRYDASVDTTLAHPELVREFDKLASDITPGYSPFEYRWAALNMRKKAANVKLKPAEIERLEWSSQLRFDAVTLPSDAGVYTLFEQGTCLFVAGTEDIEESIQSQRRIVDVELFQPELWRPKPERLAWQYVKLPDSTNEYRFGVVRSLVGRWRPVFNIPRGRTSKAAA